MSKGKNPQMGSVKRAKGGVVDVLARVEQRLNELQFSMEATRKDVIDLQRRTGLGDRVVDPVGGQPAAAAAAQACTRKAFENAAPSRESAEQGTPAKDDLPRLLNPEERMAHFGLERGGVGVAVPIDQDWEATHRVLGRVNGSPVVVTVKLDSAYRGSDPKRRLARITVSKLERWPVP